jgi:hypothetical protein
MKSNINWFCLILLVLLISSCTNTPSTTGRPQLTPVAELTTAVVTLEVTSNLPLQTSSNTSQVPTNASSSTPAPTIKISTQTIMPTGAKTASLAAKTATITPTPEIPSAAIQILAPGPASKVVTPIQISAYLKPGARGKIRLDLLGEDGRLLGRKLLVYAPDLQVHVITSMDFEIPGAAEAGRLVITTEDPQGRSLALASVDVLLMSVGDSDINPPGDLLEDIIIQEPVKSKFIQGGTVVVSGLARPQDNNSLLVEMIAPDGSHIGPTRLIGFAASQDIGYLPFMVEIPYSVGDPTWVRLVVYENSGRIPGMVHLSSAEILLGQ